MMGAIFMPPHENGRGIKCYPCQSVHHTKRRPLSKSNTFDHNFMKLGHIVKYHDVFFKFDNFLIATYLQELWSFVHENLPFEMMSALQVK